MSTQLLHLVSHHHSKNEKPCVLDIPEYLDAIGIPLICFKRSIPMASRYTGRVVLLQARQSSMKCLSQFGNFGMTTIPNAFCHAVCTVLFEGCVCFCTVLLSLWCDVCPACFDTTCRSGTLNSENDFALQNVLDSPPPI